MSSFPHTEEFDRAAAAADLGMWGRARKLLERAAAAGDLRANMKLALCHLHGLGGLDADPVAATRGFDFAAEVNLPEAHYWLAMLAAADAAAQPHKTFFDHFAAAVSLRHIAALRALGVCAGAWWALALARDAGDPISAQLLSELGPSGTILAQEDVVTAMRRAISTRMPAEASYGAKVHVCEQVLSALEARYICLQTYDALRPALVIDPLTGQSIRSALRTNSGMSITPDITDLTVRLIERKVALHAGSALLYAEPMGVIRYGPQEEYKPHRDYLHDPAQIALSTPGQRLRTAFCYLNEVALGGETEFLHWGVRVAPKLGSVVVFDNAQADGTPIADSVHAGLPVLAGEKWLATLWFRERPARLW
jgi:prolyl 4-hydroxylase